MNIIYLVHNRRRHGELMLINIPAASTKLLLLLHMLLLLLLLTHELHVPGGGGGVRAGGEGADLPDLNLLLDDRCGGRPAARGRGDRVEAGGRAGEHRVGHLALTYHLEMWLSEGG